MFRPEETINAQGDHFDECYIVDSFEYVKTIHPGTDLDLTPYFKIHTRRWDYNGIRFSISEEKLKVREYTILVKIDTLMVYPIRFHKKETTIALQQRLIGRGGKRRTILDKTYMHYNGM